MQKRDIQAVRNYTVAQSNQLIEASYTLTLDEKRLLLAAIAKLNPLADSPAVVDVYGDEFCQMFALNPKSGYSQLHNAMDRLYARTIKRRRYDERGRLVDEEMRWIYGKSKTVGAGSGKVTVRFAPELVPYLCQLRNRFTQYRLMGMFDLRDFLSIRLYELLAQYLVDDMDARNNGDETEYDSGQAVAVKSIRYMPVKDLRVILDIGEKYPTFKQFRQKVLDAAVTEINKRTNLSVSYTLEKNGRTVEKVLFKFYVNREYQQRFDF